VRGGAEKVRVRPRCGVPRLSLFRRVRQENHPRSRRYVAVTFFSSVRVRFVRLRLCSSAGFLRWCRSRRASERVRHDTARPKRQERPRASRRPTSGIRRNEEGTAMMPRSHLRTRRRSTSMHRTCTCQHGAARRWEAERSVSRRDVRSKVTCTRANERLRDAPRSVRSSTLSLADISRSTLARVQRRVSVCTRVRCTVSARRLIVGGSSRNCRADSDDTPSPAIPLAIDHYRSPLSPKYPRAPTPPPTPSPCDGGGSRCINWIANARAHGSSRLRATRAQPLSASSGYKSRAPTRITRRHYPSGMRTDTLFHIGGPRPRRFVHPIYLLISEFNYTIRQLRKLSGRKTRLARSSRFVGRVSTSVQGNLSSSRKWIMLAQMADEGCKMAEKHYTLTLALSVYCSVELWFARLRQLVWSLGHVSFFFEKHVIYERR